jgi:hypothetical protein
MPTSGFHTPALNLTSTTLNGLSPMIAAVGVVAPVGSGKVMWE